MASPAGIPSRIITSEGPCDSPAVRNRSMGVHSIRKICAPSSASREIPSEIDGRRSCTERYEIRDEAVDLIADRFLVCDQKTTIDLASGDRVELVISVCGGVSEQAKWATRCDRLARLHHRSIAPLLDYGPFAESRRFEAWRVDGLWRGSSGERDCTRRRAEDFFRAIGWSGGTSVRQLRGCAVVLPNASAGFEQRCFEQHCFEQHCVEPVHTAQRRTTHIAWLGISEIHRQSVATIAEIFG